MEGTGNIEFLPADCYNEIKYGSRAAHHTSEPPGSKQNRAALQAGLPKQLTQAAEGRRDMVKIMIVEDDRALNDGIALSFKEHEILQAYTLQQGRSEWDGSKDLVILDINLPDGSGLQLCREIREMSDVPVIFLTANDMEIDIVTGLETGADDYITKPFSLMVLRARVNTALRRRAAGNSCRYEWGGFVFDFDRMIFTCEGTAVELSRTEQRLLRALTSNTGITLTREMLIDRVWSTDERYVDSNALSVTMKRLREKLPGIPVRTVYGIGYVWEK